MSIEYTVVPDPLIGIPKHDRLANDVFTWLRAHCQWKENQKADVQPILDGYQTWERSQHGMDVAPQSILKTLTVLGFIVVPPHVIGLFLRSPDAVPSATGPIDEQTLCGGSAAPVDPHLYAANGISMEIPPRSEVTFVESGPLPRNNYVQDPRTGTWVIDKSGDSK